MAASLRSRKAGPDLIFPPSEYLRPSIRERILTAGLKGAPVSLLLRFPTFRPWWCLGVGQTQHNQDNLAPNVRPQEVLDTEHPPVSGIQILEVSSVPQRADEDLAHFHSENEVCYDLLCNPADFHCCLLSLAPEWRGGLVQLLSHTCTKRRVQHRSGGLLTTNRRGKLVRQLD